MNPFLYNIIIALVSIVYVFAVVGIMDAVVKKYSFPQDISRKVVHIAAGSWLIVWLLFDNGHWSKYLNIAPALIWLILLLIKGFTADENDEAVKTMTRTGDRKELLKGPLYFTIVMCIMGTVFYNSPMALIAMGILGWGDGLAPVFGKRFGKHKFYILSEKSMEGSLAFLIFGILGAILLNLIFHAGLNLYFILIIGLIATIIEAVSPKDLDNLLIPLGISIVYLIYY